MPPAPERQGLTVSIGEFQFAPETGEIRDAEGTRMASLPPKPAALLALLVEHAGEIVTHEAIRERLWPDTRVEYDQGVHFCMRKIRSALGESAREPKLIETLPKRGYRLVVASANGASPVANEQDRPQQQPSEPLQTGAGLKRAMVATVVAVVLMVAGGLWVLRDAAVEPTTPVLVAIMPLAPTASEAGEADISAVATELVGILGNDDRYGVIGPSTTGQFAPGTFLSEVNDSLGVDYIINARYRTEEGEARVLLEIVRTSDGVHVWTKWFEADGATEAIAPEIASELAGIALHDPSDADR